MNTKQLIGVLTFVDPEEALEDQQNTVGCTEVHATEDEVVKEAIRIAEEYLIERFGQGWVLSLEIGEHLVKLDITHPGETHPHLFLESQHAYVVNGAIVFRP